jgi:hypothetical protein
MNGNDEKTDRITPRRATETIGSLGGSLARDGVNECAATVTINPANPYRENSPPWLLLEQATELEREANQLSHHGRSYDEQAQVCHKQAYEKRQQAAEMRVAASRL